MKTNWQKFYSFFGFWTYTLNTKKPGSPTLDEYLNQNSIAVDSQGDLVWAKDYYKKYYKKEKVIYWSWEFFGRKFDLFRYKIH